MSNLYGGSLILSGSLETLSSESTGLRHITVRNESGGGTVSIHKESGGQIGYILGAESKSFHGIRPSDIWVTGPEGQTVYWDGQG